MVLHREFRIPLPMHVSEYQVAQLYGVAEESKNETGGGNGVTVIKNEPYTKENGETGQYTYKTYNIKNKVPRFVKSCVSEGTLVFHEKAWNNYPYCYTEYVNEQYGDSFKMVIISRHQPDCGNDDNVDYGDYDFINKKNVVTEIINISDNQKFPKNKYQESSDPTKYRFEAENRGPFPLGFAETTQPIMCCYKYYYISCKFPIVGRIIENFMDGFTKTFLTDFHRKIVCWMDKWFGKTMDDIRKIEKETKEQLDVQFENEPLRGTTGETL